MKDLTPKEQAILYGHALARLRARTRLSQAQAAEKLGINQQSWQRYETGSNQAFLDVALQRKCVEALGFTMDALEREVEAVMDGRPMFDMPSPPLLRDDTDRPERQSLVFPLDGVARASPEGVHIYQGDGTETFDLSMFIDKNTRFMRVFGESVYPYASSGGYISYNMVGAPKKDEGVIVRYHDGQVFVKKYIRTTNTHVECIQYEPVELEGGVTAYQESVVKYHLKDVMAVYPVGIRV
ncbi:helix-turn-helix domain-containing protein [Asticcacaulis machinosus]|uniref:Helix-turn-helix domain-containing protein n=1 Tax=Asticcacaulis machinosus TaxID=2984211 RepID=A0ABT5HGY9_9CAUL|nr:helix-turn-helix domain-containing protein [Asticcacaulis machinosus]MDC7675400.1 helix-turn-helix domain-containing protein [Asticcacaulis machinosus]